MKGEPESHTAIQLRIIGLVLIGIALFTLDSNSSSPLHTLLLPLLMAVGAACALRNVLAVALAVLALAGIRADIDHTSWVVGIAYPMLAGIAAIVVIILLARRFRERVHATREERHARRR